MGVVRGYPLLLFISWMMAVTRIGGSGLPEKTRPGAWMLDIMVGMAQKDSYASGFAFFRAVFPSLSSGP